MVEWFFKLSANFGHVDFVGLTNLVGDSFVLFEFKIVF